jgi:hypothetical protein
MTEDNSNYSWEGDAQAAKAVAAQAAKDAQAVKHAAVLEAVHEKNPFYSKHFGSEITNSLEALLAIKYWVKDSGIMGLMIFFEGLVIIGLLVGILGAVS